MQMKKQVKVTQWWPHHIWCQKITLKSEEVAVKVNDEEGELHKVWEYENAVEETETVMVWSRNGFMRT
jgi:hypothetical protein